MVLFKRKTNFWIFFGFNDEFSDENDEKFDEFFNLYKS
jgi:hypothetical protein